MLVATVSFRYGLTELLSARLSPTTHLLPGDDYHEDQLFKQMAFFGLPDGAPRRIVGYVD
jgi:hypothetical protein